MVACGIHAKLLTHDAAQNLKLFVSMEAESPGLAPIRGAEHYRHRMSGKFGHASRHCAAAQPCPPPPYPMGGPNAPQVLPLLHRMFPPCPLHLSPSMAPLPTTEDRNPITQHRLLPIGIQRQGFMTNWIKLLLFFLLSWCTPVFGQLIQPTTVTISNSTYQLIYKDKLEVNKPVSAFIQNKSGMQGMATFFFNTNKTTATIQLGNNTFGYSVTTLSTNLQLMPASNLGCVTLTNVPTGKKLVMSKNVLATSNAPVTIDLLVVYTETARLYMATNVNIMEHDIVQVIKQSVNRSNKVFEDSQVYVKLNLVGAVPLSTSYNDSASTPRAELYKVTNPADGYLDDVPALRNQYAADMVQLICYPTDCAGAAGIAWLGYPPLDAQSYSVVWAPYIYFSHAATHELGHNFGCNHDFKNGPNASLPYAYGYSFGEAYRTGTDIMPWGTTMSYVGYQSGLFSNPNVGFLGIPAGTATNNNALVINQNAATIAAYRAAPNYTLTLTKNGTGSVLLNNTNCPTTLTLARGTVLNLTAQGNFLTWTGVQTLLSTNIQLVFTNNMSLVANFMDGGSPVAPFIVMQPISQNVPYGQTLTLSASGVGIPAPSMVWYKNGSPLGINSTSFSFSNVDASKQGLYYCIVSNSAGSAQSASALVNVGNAPTFLQQPVSQIAQVGGSALMSVVLDTAVTNYQWYANDVVVAGATNRELLLTNIKSTDMTDYFVEATAPTYRVRSAPASLLLATPPNITQQPQRLGITKGQTATLTVNASGFMPLLYQWQQFGTNLPGRTNSSVVMANIQPANGGNYQVQIFNPQGVATSTNVVVTVYDPLVISAQPANLSAPKGSTPIFYVTATGAAPITYQWYRNGQALANQVYSSCRLQNVQQTNAGSYYVTINNPAGSLSSSSATLTVLDPPAITQEPQSLQADLNGSASFSVTATGKEPLAYQWFHSMSPIPGATDRTLTFTATEADAGNYMVIVTNQDGTATSAIATLSQNMPPSITLQPQSYIGTVGGSAAFYVSATGQAPLSYYWKLNGTVVGPNSAGYTLSNLATNQAGSYTVMVSNRIGTVTSTVATLAVKDPPRITATATMTVDEGSDITISPAYLGRAPMTYSWTKNGATMAGQTASTLLISSAQESASANYVVTATNPDGSATSTGTALSLYLRPRLTTSPASVKTGIGSTATFSVAALGNSLNYQWKVGSTILPNATNSSLSIPNAGLANEGNYAVYITNRIGSTSSVPVQLSITYPPVITTDPIAATVIQGGSATLSVAASGRTPMTYSWYLNNVAISGATSSTLNLSNLQLAQAGDYKAVLTNSDGLATSQAARVTVITPPVITTQPTDSTLTKGATYANSVAISSSATCNYQWAFNGSALPGATTAYLSLPSIQPAQAGTYQVTISNPAGSVTSRAALLTVKDPPVFTIQPANATVKLNETLTLSSSATSSLTISYQWYKGASALAGKTGATLTIANVDASIAGTYSVKASNTDGTVSSTAVTVSFQTQPPVFTVNLPATYTVDPEATLQLSVTATGLTPMTYSWTFNGSTMAGQTTASITIPNVTTNHAGTYQVTVVNPDGTARSTMTTVTVLAIPPSILQQPANVLTTRGANATYSVTCLNPVGLAYQWYKNSVLIPNATNQTLTLASVSDAEVGSYNVEVANAHGRTASAFATLSLINTPVLTTDLSDCLITRNVASTFTVAAQASGTVSYKWFFKGALVSGAVQSTYTIVGSTNTEGTYYAVVANEAGSVTSRTAIATLKIPTSFVLQPASSTNKPGDNVSFIVSATGRGTVSYQWAWKGANLPGKTDNVLILNNLQISSSGAYTVSASALDGTVTSQTATLTIDNPPTIVTQPQDAVIPATTKTTTLTVVAGSSTPMGYQWKFAGNNLAGATASQLTLANATSLNEGYYSVTVQNAVGATNSRQAFVKMSQPPTFSTQPVGAVVVIGGSLTMNAVVTGRATLYYQWQKQGVNIAGATTSSLTLNNVQNPDFGTYQLIVTNSDGITLSSQAELIHSPTDQMPPSFTAEPTTLALAAGATATFSATTTGTAPQLYQWKRNGIDIPNATATTLTLASVTSANAGSYTLLATNDFGSATSSPAQLSVFNPPVILTQPNSLTSTQNQILTLSLTTSNATHFFWKQNDTPLTTTTTPELTLSNVQASVAGTYLLTCSNLAGTATSSAITVTICTPPVITAQPVGSTVSPGSPITMSATVTGSAPLTYQWYFGANPIASATTSVLTINNAQSANEGYYSLKVANPYGNATSASTPVTVKNAPVLTLQPTATKSVVVGASLNLSVSATGRAPLTYQWYFGANPIAGANSNSLTIANMQTGNAGSYYATVVNADGTAISQSSTVSVLVAPYFVSSLLYLRPNAGLTIQLSASVYGTDPITFQWYQNGSKLAGATSSMLIITNVQLANDGTYTVAATNAAGYGTFTPYIVSTKAPPVIVTAPASALVAVGTNYTFSAVISGRTPMTYQWYKNGAVVAGATSSSYSINNAQPSHSGFYCVYVVNSDGAVSTPQASLSVSTAPFFTMQPRSVRVPFGQNTNIYYGASSETGWSCDWYKDGVILPNFHGWNLSLTNVQVPNEGNYYAVIYNNAGYATSQVATVTVIYPPSIVTQPISQIVNQGSSVSMEVTTTGKEPMTYTWKFNGKIVESVASRIYAIQNAQLSQAGQYSCIISNADGYATSSSATLTVRAIPQITEHPSTTIITVSNAFTLYSAGTATSFQWYKDGTNISGATAQTYSSTNAQFSDQGTYTVQYRNAYGSVMSEPAVLLILPPQPMILQTNNIRPFIARIIHIADGSKGLIYSGPLNKTFTIQASTDLTNWTTLQSVTLVNAIGQYVDRDAVNYRLRYYRLQGK